MNPRGTLMTTYHLMTKPEKRTETTGREMGEFGKRVTANL